VAGDMVASLRPTSSVAGEDPTTCSSSQQHKDPPPDIGCSVIPLPCFDGLPVQRPSTVRCRHIRHAIRLGRRPSAPVPHHLCQPEPVRSCHAHRLPTLRTSAGFTTCICRSAWANQLLRSRPATHAMCSPDWTKIGFQYPVGWNLGQIAACGAYFRFLGTWLVPPRKPSTAFSDLTANPAGREA